MLIITVIKHLKIVAQKQAANFLQGRNKGLFGNVPFLTGVQLFDDTFSFRHHHTNHKKSLKSFLTETLSEVVCPNKP